MAIHVMEHFYLWEVLDILKEWQRVLKPGGKIVLECPDVLRAAQRFVEGEGNPAFTYWVFYGDPSHKDPLMCHRWGYFPGSLAGVLEHAGFKNIRQEPAEFHMKNKRDFRLVAEAP